MRKKRRTSYGMLIMVVIILMSMITGCSTSLEKIPIPTVEKNVYIYDDDNIIDDDVEKKLNKMLVELEKKTEAEFAVVSVKSLQDRSIEDYANNLFNTLGIGKKGKDNGALLLFSRSDKKVRLEIGRGLEGCLNDSKCGRILDKYFVPYRENDEYSKATEMTVKAVLNVLAEEYKINIQGVESDFSIDEADSNSDEELPSWALIIIVIILIVLIIIGAICCGGSSSGGNFGGGFSSGGFSGGGFGGGFSGGGGASR